MNRHKAVVFGKNNEVLASAEFVATDEQAKKLADVMNFGVFPPSVMVDITTVGDVPVADPSP